MKMLYKSKILVFGGLLSLFANTAFSDEFTVSYQVGDAVVLELWNIDDYLLVEGPTVDGIRVVTRYDFSATNETRLASFSDALAAGNPETITIDLYNEGSGYTYAGDRINGVAEASNGCGAYNVSCDGNSICWSC